MIQKKELNEIAVEAAKIIIEEGVDESYSAIKKAIKRLNINNYTNLPSDADILEQIKIYQSLHLVTDLVSKNSSDNIKKLYSIIYNIMQLFKSFEPKLIYSLLLECGIPQGPIKLLVTVDTTEEIAFFLMHNNIAYHTEQWRLFINKQQSTDLPAYSFVVDHYSIKLMLLTEKHRKTAPMDPTSGKPIKKLSIAQVSNLL